VLSLMLGRSQVFADLLQSFYTRPALLILSTFGALAGLGGLLLTFPAASATAAGVPFIDAMFTATSATCVTGLIVLDTPNAFSTLGHVIILALIQLGGLGIMVLSTFATVLLGGRLGLRGEQALEEVLDLASPGSAYELTRFIVVSTLLIEAVGAALLTLAFHFTHGMAWADALWRASFHAVSAFCNAGFALWTDSLIPFQSDALVIGVHAALIVFGGLGFTVLATLWLRLRGQQRRMSLQTRIVLALSVGLIVGGTLLYALTEWDASLAPLGVGDKLLNAAFQSVSLRTAGFQSVDFGGLERSTILMMIVWMFIGASPGSTGGGIKTTTLAVMLAAIPALIRNQPRALLLRRTVPHDIVYRAATIMTVATMVAIAVIFLLLATHDRLSFEKAAFEAVSALATVGLTIGATPELNAAGKWMIIVTMFIGRVGPISLALALGSGRSSNITFPEARIMVG
jgi:trk system potassium uptake protein